MPKTPRSAQLHEQFIEPGLVEWRAAAFDGLDLALIAVHARHGMAYSGQTDARHEPNVACSDDGDLQG